MLVAKLGWRRAGQGAKEARNHNEYAAASRATTDRWKEKNGDGQNRRPSDLRVEVSCAAYLLRQDRKTFEAIQRGITNEQRLHRHLRRAAGTS